MKTPCEIIVWNVVPLIRREFAQNLINKHKLNQRETADKLGITEAAVSRYVAGKRAALGITNKKILKEIQHSTNRILKENGTSIIEETCRICRLIKKTESIKGIDSTCE
jgi:predicted transcriptional regulator